MVCSNFVLTKSRVTEQGLIVSKPSIDRVKKKKKKKKEYPHFVDYLLHLPRLLQARTSILLHGESDSLLSQFRCIDNVIICLNIVV